MQVIETGIGTGTEPPRCRNGGTIAEIEMEVEDVVKRRVVATTVTTSLSRAAIVLVTTGNYARVGSGERPKSGGRSVVATVVQTSKISVATSLGAKVVHRLQRCGMLRSKENAEIGNVEIGNAIENAVIGRESESGNVSGNVRSPSGRRRRTRRSVEVTGRVRGERRVEWRGVEIPAEMPAETDLDEGGAVRPTPKRKVHREALECRQGNAAMRAGNPVVVVVNAV